jgi:hypothetical protein
LKQATALDVEEVESSSWCYGEAIVGRQLAESEERWKAGEDDDRSDI